MVVFGLGSSAATSMFLQHVGNEKLEQLRLAETKLLEYAKRFGTTNNKNVNVNGEDSNENKVLDYKIEVFDTPIPTSTITNLINKNHDEDRASNDESILGNIIALCCCRKQQQREVVVVNEKKKDDDYDRADPSLDGDKYNNNRTHAHKSRSGSDPTQQENLVIHGIHVTSSSKKENKETKEQGGSNEQTKPPPLVLLHGYMNASAYFYRNFLGLAKYFDSIYSLDLLGWGLSSRPRRELFYHHDNSAAEDDVSNHNNHDNKKKKRNVAEDLFVESLEQWRRAHKLEKMILVGHSMGGYISVAYCERYPQYVDKLILLSPVGVPEETPEERKNRQTSIQNLTWRYKYPAQFYEYMYNQHNYSIGDFLRMIGTISTTRIRNLALQYVERRLPAITSREEQVAVANYLFASNVLLPGSGEYCIHSILTPFAMAKNPLVNRIPHLRISNVTFLYGAHDWMSYEGAIQCRLKCEDRLRNSNNENNKGETSNKNKTSSPPTTATTTTTTTTAKQVPPSIKVYQIRNAGHLLMLDNWEGTNAGILLGAGAEDDGGSSPIPTDSPIRPIELKQEAPSSSKKSSTW